MADTPDLFSDSIPEKACPLCKGPFGAALSVREDLWAALAPKGPAQSDDVCPNCVVEKLSDLHRYGVIRIAVLSDDAIVDAEARRRRAGWIAVCQRLEEVSGSFGPMTTLLDMLEKDPDGTITFANGFNQTLKECFNGYCDEFFRRVEQLRQDAPPGDFGDKVIRETVAQSEGTGA